MKIKRKLCKPCAEALKAAGTHIVTPTYGATDKIDCFRCKRRRFGSTYIVEKIPTSKAGEKT